MLETTQNIDGEEFTRGINDFISAGVFQSAFPLHDGDWKWTDQGYLNDRQVKWWFFLAKKMCPMIFKVISKILGKANCMV